MNTFVNAAVQTPDSFTENGANTFASSLNACVDLFFRIGASRGRQNTLVDLFRQALTENRKLAVRILLWARDARGGAGEREAFRVLVSQLTTKERINLVAKVVELGRWDDLFALSGEPNVDAFIGSTWAAAIAQGNGLAAKWAPRKGPNAVKLRKLWNMTPKQYRKFVVAGTKVVEQQMCAKQWNEIEFSHVPSVAAARYNAAFYRNAPELYGAYKDALVKGETKINASAIFPHDVIRSVSLHPYGSGSTTVDGDVIDAQWKALPDYCNGKASNILVMSDVSGSMFCAVSGSVTAMHVSVALGLYISERQVGPFKDLVLTFSTDPQFHKVHGSGIVSRASNLSKAKWGGSTDINKAFNLILKTAQDNSVPAEDMPKTLLILSDMEFDHCGKLTNMQALRKMYSDAGYELPNVVFWNLNSRSQNVPVRFDEHGVALVSGFSPSILTAVLGAEDLSPATIVSKAVMKDRYDVPSVTV